MSVMLHTTEHTLSVLEIKILELLPISHDSLDRKTLW